MVKKMNNSLFRRISPKIFIERKHMLSQESKKKIKELIFAEKAKQLLNKEWCIKSIPEPLDFEVQYNEEIFGLEITDVFIDTSKAEEEEKKTGSRSKKSESDHNNIVSEWAQRYYSKGGSPICAEFLERSGTILDMKDHSLDDLIYMMIEKAPKDLGVNDEFELHGVKVFMTYAGNLSEYSNWPIINHKVGWVKQNAEEDILAAINKKKKKLSEYKKKYEHIELLLVAYPSNNSGKLLCPDNISVSDSGFRAIYFMSYPESIQQIC